MPNAVTFTCHSNSLPKIFGAVVLNLVKNYSLLAHFVALLSVLVKFNSKYLKFSPCIIFRPFLFPNFFSLRPGSVDVHFAGTDADAMPAAIVFWMRWIFGNARNEY